MSPRLVDVMIFALTRPALVSGVLVATAIGGSLATVLLREKCGICGERVRVPLEAHQMFNHAGDGGL